MSGPADVAMPILPVQPVQPDGARHSEADTTKLTSAIRESLNEKGHPEDHNRRRDSGPLKEMIAHQDSLYKYMSWEDPVRTLGSYMVVLSFLFGIHYLPLTKFALKAAATTLGAVSAMEFAGRVFGPNTFLARLRPKEYKQFPESTLNATLKDIHDFIQYAAVHIQRIIFGQDLDYTLGAFIGCTALYWLIKVISPFGISVLCLTSVYIASLVMSPRGREVTRDAKARTGELASAAADKGTALAQKSKKKVTHKARDSGIYIDQPTEDMAQGGKEAVGDLSTRAKNIASDVSEATVGAANSAVETTKQMAPQIPGITKGGATQQAADDNITSKADYPKSAFEHLENTAYSSPGQTPDKRTSGRKGNRDWTVPDIIG
ncbi:Reticulon-domain-containing protein [Thelonectria olida]|uniref:Reticulon-domain-containing protein n=1 Tax=Thelonectria olida TaxID=1576542 RepID=A0A9P8W593_9HYPO|nr:Reticulon-domain-containing protein [Thelonectria olida]